MTMDFFTSLVCDIFSPICYLNDLCASPPETDSKEKHINETSNSSNAGAFKLEYLQPVKDDLSLTIPKDLSEKDQLLIAHFLVKALKNSSETPESIIESFNSDYNKFHENDFEIFEIRIDVKDVYAKEKLKEYSMADFKDYKFDDNYEHMLLYQYDMLGAQDKDQIKIYLDFQLSKFNTDPAKTIPSEPRIDLYEIAYSNLPSTIISKAISSIFQLPKFFDQKTSK